ncbi:MAG: ABC transporter substrate-binding protein [Deltaproteobacteria bacterium]|nr:ABC transporter substrate-binding protein [Deltaproteobacteria bacterium]MBW2069872.1 ABC transporter substrate-binding protein [Deltaproteobacteria bacterium]
MKKFLVMIVSGVFLAVVMVGGIPALSQAAGQVVIGSINPLTGTNAVQGQDMKRGEELALAEINAAGGVLGHPLKIIWEDTESSPKGGMDAVHKLVEIDKVPLILGAYSSGISLPTGQWTNSKKVIQISEASTSPKLREIGPYFFNVMGLDEVMGTKLAQFALESGANTFASITVNNPFGIGVEIWTEKTIKKAGKKWLEAVRYDEKKTDYRAEIERLFAKKPEAVFFTAYGTESKLILKQAYELGYKPPKGWYADYMTMWSNEVIPETAEGIKGLIMGSTETLRYPEYQKAYREKFGPDAKQTAFGAYAYDATWIAALAINMAGSTNTDKIATALYTASKIYNGVTGDKSFDKDGMQVTDYYQRMIYKGGKLQPYK